MFVELVPLGLHSVSLWRNSIFFFAIYRSTWYFGGAALSLFSNPCLTEQPFYILLSFISSGDDSINLAGGISKFVTDISVSFNGNCVWSGPATFKTTCEMQVDEWPFDEQKCELSFGSYTYGEKLMRIRLFKDKSDFASKESSLILLWSHLTL